MTVDPDKLFRKYKTRFIKELGRGQLYNDQLDVVGCREFNNKWNGVFPQDRYIDRLGFQILNTDNDGMKGKHWVAVYRTPKKIYIYDSFGRPTSKLLRGLSRVMKGSGVDVIDADYDQEQRGNSEVCGVLCLSWLCCVRDLGIRSARRI